LCLLFPFLSAPVLLCCCWWATFKRCDQNRTQNSTKKEPLFNPWWFMVLSRSSLGSQSSSKGLNHTWQTSNTDLQISSHNRKRTVCSWCTILLRVKPHGVTRLALKC
jgi:hypothetical protein